MHTLDGRGSTVSTLREPDPSSSAALRPAVSLKDVIISDEMRLRRIRKVNARAEIAGMHALANLLPKGYFMVLKGLAQLAIELCDAGSSGISILEADSDGQQLFRWEALAGELETCEGRKTPGDWSPCGECLKAGKPMLYSYPARFFTYFQDVDTTIVEGLVIPMYADALPIGTIWIVSHNEERKFDAEDVRVMTSLGSFVTAALRLALRRGTRSADEAGVAREVVWGEFVRRITRGDCSALEALVEETRPLVFRKALLLLGFRADAEEVVADVYSQVWRTAVRYDSERGTVLAWLLNIARSRAMDRLRSRASHHQRSEVALSFECSSASDPEAHAATAETKRHVRQALQALPFEQRRVIELAYFSGYSMTEIAVQLAHPIGTVKTRVRSGLIGLRRLLATGESHRPPNKPSNTRPKAGP